jgi:hypothetical protein
MEQNKYKALGNGIDFFSISSFFFLKTIQYNIDDKKEMKR